MQQELRYFPTKAGYLKKNSKKTYKATIGSKYQMVIPKEVRSEMNLKPGDKLYVDAVNENTIYLIVPQKSWADQNYGALKRYWKGIDMVKEVKKIRDEL